MKPLDMFPSRVNALQARIKLDLANGAHLIVGIDGAGGVGKSTLAKRLAEEFDGRLVSLDDYLDDHKGTYIPHLNYQRLKNDIYVLLSQDTPVLAIEGLCLLAALEQVGTNPDILVYIKCLDQDGEWYDEAICNENRELNEVLDYLSKYETLPGIGDSDRELATYHNKYRPVAKADFVLSKVIGPGHDIF